MRVVFLGPPGAGKGTQAARFAAEHGIPHVSTGDMLRAARRAGTPIGLEAKRYMDAGKLVPDEVIAGVVRERLAADDCSDGYLLDGFPRTVPQAQLLEPLLAEQDSGLDHVVYFDVPEQELVDRLSQRVGPDGRRRADDDPEVVRNRLRVYEAETSPLVGWYEERGLLRRIDGVGAVEGVYERLRLATESSED